jgi:hypothetical protein
MVKESLDTFINKLNILLYKVEFEIVDLNKRFFKTQGFVVMIYTMNICHIINGYN